MGWIVLAVIFLCVLIALDMGWIVFVAIILCVLIVLDFAVNGDEGEP